MDATAQPPSRKFGWKLASLLLGAVVIAGIAQASGSTLALPLGTAFLPAGFALMAVLARLGDTEPAARPLGLMLVTATLSALALGSLALIVLHVVEPGSLREAGQDVEFAPGGESRLSFMMGLLALSGAATMLGLFRAVRQAVQDIIPIDPTLYSHAIGLSTAIAVTLMPLLPLFVLGRPPLPFPPNALPAGSPSIVLPSFVERSLELAWFALATLIAAGPGSGRSWILLRHVWDS